MGNMGLETQVSRGQKAQVLLLYGGQNGVSASAGGGGDEVRKARVGRFVVQKHGDCEGVVARRERAGRAGARSVKGVGGLTNAVAVRSGAASNCVHHGIRSHSRVAVHACRANADQRQMMSWAGRARAAWPVSAMGSTTASAAGLGTGNLGMSSRGLTSNIQLIFRCARGNPWVSVHCLEAVYVLTQQAWLARFSSSSCTPVVAVDRCNLTSVRAIGEEALS